MKTYRLQFAQNLPIPLAETWDFFTSPLNLAKITPPQMRFEVTSPYEANSKVYEGMIITYKITPLFGIKMNWMTEITHVKDQQYFVDEQRFGPYALWHHEHHFKEIKGGVQMTDILNYAVPYGVIGRLSNKLLVGNEIKKIFKYREKAINEMFGVYRQS
ncbi:SRPBCC family protein [Mucilaginibacter corticis]|uniref:SRPBCC family protein n=1 Tax=Mucilaginibacter corticis TaxID=2597670 RepID=A0A556MUQ0_9SPHI|nr:SRPBCC family protein [Mucilaginibacter corticis]TSJ43582.1 SRPBCC family protein [Mucilaginibacter corticis]